MTEGQKKIQERRDRILETVRTEGFAEVSALSGMLGVTPKNPLYGEDLTSLLLKPVTVEDW